MSISSLTIGSSLPRNFRLVMTLLVGLILAFPSKTTLWGFPSERLQTLDESAIDNLIGHSRIKELIARGENRSLSRSERHDAALEAVEEARSENDRGLELRVLTASLKIILPTSEVNEYKILLDRAIELSQEIDDPRLTAQVQLAQASHYKQQLRYDKCIEWLKKAQASKLLPKHDLGKSYNDLAFCCGRLGLVGDAFDASHQVIELFKDDRRAQLAQIAYANIAWMYVRSRRYDRAKKLYDEMALTPEDRPYFFSLIGRCVIALHQKDVDLAIRLSQLGLDHAESTDRLKGARKNRITGVLLLIQSQCFYRKEKFTKAQTLCEQAIKLVSKKSHRYPEARTQLGMIVAKRDSPERAIEIVRKAFNDAMELSECRMSDKVHTQLFSSENLTKLYSENGYFEEAYAQLQQTEEIKNSLDIENLELRLKLNETRRRTELDEQQLELVKTEEQAKAAQAKLLAANAISDAEKSKTIRNVIVTVFILTLLGSLGYYLSENRRRQAQHQLNKTREKNEYQERLAHEKRNEDIGQLTGSVAHDFNNILQVISQTDCLFGDSLDAKLTAEQKELLEKKSTVVNAAAKITGQLLTYARRQAITPKVALVSTMLQSTEALFDSIGDLIQVNVLNFDDTLAIDVDQPQFSSSILNLLLNARDAMEGKGLVDVKVSEQLVTVTDSPNLRPGKYVQIQVVDTGKGMTAKQLERACEPFFTTKPPATGKGLGLSSVKGFVEQAGGAIDIQSELGVGTTISLYFPKIGGAEVRNLLTETKRNQTRISDQVCLIVEDNIDTRTDLALMIESLGFDCKSCGSTDEAHALLKSAHDFTLVLANADVPGEWNGVDLARWIQGRFPKLHVVLMSDSDAASKLGEFNFLRKPIRFADLQTELQLERV